MIADFYEPLVFNRQDKLLGLGIKADVIYDKALWSCLSQKSR